MSARDFAEDGHVLQEVDPRFWHDDTSGVGVIMIRGRPVCKESGRSRGSVDMRRMKAGAATPGDANVSLWHQAAQVDHRCYVRY